MDIYALIHNDHESATRIIEQINALPDTRHSERLILFRHLKEDLLAHNDAEDASLYEALRQHDATLPLARDSSLEHDNLVALLDNLDSRQLSPAAWRNRFARMQQAFFHHIREEESSVFAAARRILNPATATRLTETMQRIKFLRRELLRKAS